ncbi:MAG: flavodoxin family protein [Deltaproteobacteria bacterium]|nr:flavodoxin family protein [Deltaproteobacteria bacterium]
MEIMAFVGSPRKGSNVDTLVDRVLAGADSSASVEAEKIYLYEADIKNCIGCLACTALKGGQPCPLKDAMPGILARMINADAFIFSTPNYVHSMSAALTNFFCRMQPLIKMDIIRDAQGNITGADATTLISGKRAVAVVSQGDFSPSRSALILRSLESNLRDFKLKAVGEVLSTGNLEKAAVKDKPHDLDLAFAVGARLASK